MWSLRVSGIAIAVLTVGCTIQTVPGSPGYVSSATSALEVNVDRPGSDYRSFDLATPSPEQCRDTCMVEPQCVAFTYVNLGVQGPTARCWLKSAVPNATPNGCCVSGVKNAAPSASYQASASTAPAPEPPPPPPPAQPAPPPPPPAWTGTPPVRGQHGLEVNIDRPGSDYSSFDLQQANPHLCKQACAGDARCVAFTYVNPGVQGPSPRCWLKNAVPRSVPNGCCTSGVKGPHWGGGHAPPPPPGPGLEYNVDRPGWDISNFDLPQANPQLCRDACMRDGNCRAFTYVNPGVQGPNPRCWLKGGVPNANPNNCCVSGVK
jgi:hypothetical protein